MSDEYKLQLNLKVGNDLLNVRANTADELKSLIDEARHITDLARFFGAVPTQAAPASSSSTGDSSVPSDAEAADAIARHLGAGQEEPATKAQVTVLVSRGVPEEEAKALSKTAAAAKLQEGK